MRLNNLDYKEIMVKVVLLLGALTLLAAIASVGYLLFNPHLWDKLWKVMSYNMNFWFLMVTGFIYGLWRKHKNPVEFTWREYPIQLFGGIIVTIGCFGSFLFYTSGLDDTEVWNGWVTVSEYYEEWEEEVTYPETHCTGSGDNQICTTVMKTRIDYHPPYWQVRTSNGETVSISRNTYNKYVKRFGGHVEHNLSRINQVSIGDGDKYVATWNGEEKIMVATSVEHSYVNYLKASQSIGKFSGVSGPYQDFLLSYPRVTGGNFGLIEFNRVVSAGVDLPVAWKTIVDNELDKSLAYLGKQKELNVVVYTVPTTDKAFLHALEEHWVFGKKNDVVVVLGTPEFPKVSWAGVMVFHGNHELKVKLRDSILAMNDISDPKLFSELLVNHFIEYFKRVPMEELEYLLHDIEMPFWALLIVWLLVGTSIFVISFVLENNETRNWRFKR